MFNNYPAVKEFLTSKIKTCRVLVVGDVMFEHDYLGDRISWDKPVNCVLREEKTLGGAANAAHNLTFLGCNVFFTAVIGEDENWARLVNILNGLGISSEGLVSIKKKPTNIKIRIIGGSQHLPRLEFEKTNPINIAGDKKIRLYVESSIEAGTNVIIISDYGKGVCTPGLCRYILKRGNEAKIPVLIAFQGRVKQNYSQPFPIAPNLIKLGKNFSISIADNDKTITALAEIISKANLHLNELAVTCSEKGLNLVFQNAKFNVPSFRQEVFDVFGVSDTFVAALGAALAARINLPDAALFANLAAGIVVNKTNALTVSCEELMAAVELMEN